MSQILENLSSFVVSSNIAHLLLSPHFFLGKNINVVRTVTKSKFHLLPKSRLSLDPPVGALQLSPAVSLPLLAKLPPRVNCSLKEKQQGAANKVEEERGKHNDTKYLCVNVLCL